jgi:hypothetical protein
VIGIEVEEAHVAVLPNNLQFVSKRSIYIFRSEIIDRASFGLPIYQWPVDFRVFHQRFDVVG